MTGFIYAIRALDWVKIGFTSGEPQVRLRALQTGSPVDLSLVGWSHGSLEIEAGIHAALAQYRERGEWFRYEGPVVDFVARIAKHWPKEGCSYGPEDDLGRRSEAESRRPGTGASGRSEGAVSVRPDREGDHAEDSGSEGPDSVGGITPAERSRLWRQANRERYNAAKREQMRRKRLRERQKSD